jgi:uncharacterized Tic20 family protein
MNDTDPVPPATPPTPAHSVPDPQHGGVSAEERQWAMIAHLSALLGGVATGGWGHSLACFVGPLIVWLVKKDTMPFVDDQGKEALNFNITVTIVFVILALFSVMTLGIGLIIAIPAYIVIALLWLVFTIVAAIKSHEGVAYRYPFALRLIK